MSKPIYEEEAVTAENHRDHNSDKHFISDKNNWEHYNRHHRGSARRHEGIKQEQNNDPENEGMGRKSYKDDHNSRMMHHLHRGNSDGFKDSYESRKYHDSDDGDHRNDNENDAIDDQFINEHKGYEDGEGGFYNSRRHSLSSPNNNGRGRIITTSASKQNPNDLYEQIRMYIKRSKVPKISKVLKRSKLPRRSKVLKGNHKELLHKRNHINHHHSSKNNNKRNKMAQAPDVRKSHHQTSRDEISKRMRDSRTIIVTKKTNIKPANNITTRNDVVPSHIENLHHDEDTAIVNGETETNNYGTQFSDPYHSESKANGNNGYSKGEYFGADVPDTGDNTPLLGSAAGSRDAAAFFANDNGAGLVKSFLSGGDAAVGAHTDVLMDSERFEGFEKHHHHHESGL